MSFRRRIARNAVWSGAGMACGAVTGFITVPFLVHHLGSSTYGLWILIASLTSYFNLIDLGLRSSITRHVAFFRAKGDRAAANSILSTATLVLLGAAAVTVLATLCLAVLFTRFGHIPPDQNRHTRIAILLAGLTIAVTLAMSVFDAALYAYERFDLLNGIDIVLDLVQTACLFYLVWRGGGLVTIATVVFIGTTTAELAKAAACFVMDPDLRLAPTNASRWAMRLLFGFGIWRFLWSVGTRATAQGGPLIIWARLTPAAATPYGVAARLVGTVKGIATAGMAIITPTATALHANDQHERQRILFLEGGRYCLALSVLFAAGISLLGESFIRLWMGPALATYATAATILALGEVLPTSQWVSSSILLGRERHRVLAVASFVETCIVIALGLALARPLGFLGVCLAIAIPGAICRGVLPIVYGGRVLGVAFGAYVRSAVLPPVLAMAIPALAIAALVRQRPPGTWADLMLYSCLLGLAYAVACVALVVGPEQTRQLIGQVRSHPLWPRFARITPSGESL